MKLTEFINGNSVVFTDKNNKYQVLDELIEKAFLEKKIKDRKQFKTSIEEREMLMSTGIGLEVAIPHSKIESIEDFFIILGVLKNPVEWDSIDHKPVRGVFLIGGPENKQKEYLRLLSQIIVIVKNDDKRGKIFCAETADEVLKVFI